jgi:hypothetical protein
MTAHEEQMENEDGQPKTVMIPGAIKLRKALALKFGRGERRYANFATISETVLGNLKRICID